MEKPEEWIDLMETGCKCMDWIRMSQDRDRWWTLLNTVMNILVL